MTRVMRQAMTQAGGAVDMDQLVTRHHPPATASNRTVALSIG